MGEFQAELDAWAGWGTGVLATARGGGGVELLRLEDMAAVLGSLGQVVKLAGSVLSEARSRGAVILDSVRRDAGPNGGVALALDLALLDVEFGTDSLMAGFHLVTRGQAALSKVARDERERCPVLA